MAVEWRESARWVADSSCGMTSILSFILSLVLQGLRPGCSLASRSTGASLVHFPRLPGPECIHVNLNARLVPDSFVRASSPPPRGTRELPGRVLKPPSRALTCACAFANLYQNATAFYWTSLEMQTLSINFKANHHKVLWPDNATSTTCKLKRS